MGPLAAHGRRHSAGGAPNWGGTGHPKEKEGAAAPSTEVHRGPGGPLAEPKAAGVTPAAVNPRRGCRRGEEEVGGDGGGRAGSKGRKERKGKKRKERRRKRKRREGDGRARGLLAGVVVAGDAGDGGGRWGVGLSGEEEKEEEDRRE